ncbi:Pre-mRNA cleavage complex II Clp1 [Penicillium hetheringtonii]|uniref:Polynucleotide 5'-hydroxyl-kinase GRC3 n=1 Tax=Penicillium hetheringtonii TaxID=911720 RepID=A0AAD6H2W7_9EURO|nr:Pre-mRNA cleavage complex II Clp1 [Penicillium hetheringtonii]
MSLPGLELTQPSDERQNVVAPPSQINLTPGSEWRFEVAFGHSIKVKLLTGTAEIFGTELAESQTYTFSGAKAAIYSWHGCELEVSAGETHTATFDGVTPTAGHGAGGCQSEYVSEETPMVEYANAHFALESMREETQDSGKDGPRVLLLGPDNAGKTSVAKILTAYATKVGRQPIVVNLDPNEGCSVYLELLPQRLFEPCWMLKRPSRWGWICLSSDCVTTGAVCYGSHGRDEDSRETGIIVDTPGILSSGKPGTLELINHIVTEFAITTIMVLGSERLYSNMVKQYDNKPSASASADAFDERIAVVKLSKSGGCVDRDAAFLKTAREFQIKSYFFGTSIISPSPTAITLSPHTSQLDFAALSVYNYTVTSADDEDEDEYDPSQLSMGDSFSPSNGGDNYNPAESDRAAPLPGIVGLSVDPASSAGDLSGSSKVPLKKVLPPAPTALANTLLAITHAPTTATPAQVRDASIIGFLYVASVEPDKGKIHVLAPVGGRVPQRAMIWAKRWPDEVIGLVN